ncbi:MAG: redoxin family protein [Verrucomicrobiales bacterium]|nr:redoxin family protein [Verrucomicrobiales bacterium]
MNSRFPMLLLALCTGLFSTRAATLGIGDPAPKLQTGKWIQGDPVATLEPGKTYLVEFWATWCGPCRTSIPHLNEVAAKFKDRGLVVIGQDAWENDESLVEPFVKKMGTNMTYRVALDHKQGSEKGTMAETWMEAAGQNGIPTAFLVDPKGRIAWIGHPMTLEEKVLSQVISGTYDLQKAAADFAEQERRNGVLEAAWRKLRVAIQARDWDTAESDLAGFAKQLPENDQGGLDRVRLDIFFGRGNYDAGFALMGRMADAHPGEPMIQNELAWRIVSDPALEKRDLVLAERLALRARTLTQGRDPAILDTLARVRFLQGMKTEAIELQEAAVKLADDDARTSLGKTLESYRKGTLPKPE